MAQKIDFTAKGNAVGFDAQGRIITGRKQTARGLAGKGDWVIEVGDRNFAGAELTNGLRRCFAHDNKPGAVAYATSLIDPAKTAELAWW